MFVSPAIGAVVGTQYLPHCYCGSVSQAPTTACGRTPHIAYLVYKHPCKVEKEVQEIEGRCSGRYLGLPYGPRRAVQ